MPDKRVTNGGARPGAGRPPKCADCGTKERPLSPVQAGRKTLMLCDPCRAQLAEALGAR